MSSSNGNIFRVTGHLCNREAGDLRRCPAHYDVIVMFQKRLSKESSGIRVLALCPGSVKTTMTKRTQEMEDAGDPEAIRIVEKFGGWVP